MFDMDDDDAREFVRRLFAPLEDVPDDIVPQEPMTREERRQHLLAMNRMADGERWVTTPGEVIEDVDGVPIGVGAPTRELVFIGAATITPKDLEQAGLTRDDVPNLHVHDFQSKESKDD